MQDAGTVLAVLRERGRKGLPCNELYRQMFNRKMYLLAYGRVATPTSRWSDRAAPYGSDLDGPLKPG